MTVQPSFLRLCEPTGSVFPEDERLYDDLPVKRWRLDGTYEELSETENLAHLVFTNMKSLSAQGQCQEWEEKDVPPLHLAAQYDLRHLALSLLRSGSEVDAADEQGRYPLHRAAAFGHEAVAELLLAYGADSNRPDVKGTTPLHFAARNGGVSVASLLLAYGASSDREDMEGLTPLHYAAENFREALADLFHLHEETERFIHNLPVPALSLELTSLASYE